MHRAADSFIFTQQKRPQLQEINIYLARNENTTLFPTQNTTNQTRPRPFLC